MAVLPIRLIPDPVLRQKCHPVEVFDTGLERFAQDMVETMHAAPGIGLAAPQVGDLRRLVVVDLSVGDDPDQLKVFVNPVIHDPEGQDSELEGCLSIPELTEKVKRPEKLRLAYQDLSGRPQELAADGWLARAICHEVDHLDGVLFIDHLRGLRRERTRRQLKKLLKRRQEELSES
ncbi:MAG: peptide deformylase [Acidobacteriota bacterium]